jgi:hypothetical protein
MRTWHLRIHPWKLKTRWARSYVCIMVKLKICYYLISVFQICLGTMTMMIEYGYVMKKTDLRVQAHQSPTFGSSVAWQCFIAKVITRPSGVRLRSMSTWWKNYLINFQIDLVPPQYHVGKVFKSSRHYAVVFYRVLRRRCGLIIHTWDPGSSWSMPQEDGEHLKDA